jgi:hypothetical protein
VLATIDSGTVKTISTPVRFVVRLLEPLLGAMPVSAKARLEQAIDNPMVFSQSRATALSVVLNLILYPAVLTALSVLVIGDSLFSLNTRGWITLGLLLGTVETCWRLREGVLLAKPMSELVYRGCLWGVVLLPLATLLARGPGFMRSERKVSFDGFTTDLYDEKIERDRRYGTVYTVVEHSNAYLVRLEMPRKIPASSLKRLWNLPDEMPDYEYNIALEDGVLIINASLRGETLRRLAYVSASFPSDFETRIEFHKPVAAFKHRLRHKVIEAIVLKGEARQELERAA